MAVGQVVVFPPLVVQNTTATVAQLKQALAAIDITGLVKFNIPDDPTNLITIGWFEDLFPNSGALYNFIQAQLSYTSAQMTSFYATLSSYTVRP